MVPKDLKTSEILQSGLDGDFETLHSNRRASDARSLSLMGVLSRPLLLLVGVLTLFSSAM